MFDVRKFRLAPFPDQERELLRQLDELRFLWNHALQARIDAHKRGEKSVGFVDQEKALTRWRAFDKDGIGRVYSHVAQDLLARLDDAYKHFFRRVRNGEQAGFPRFKREVTSLTYPDGNGSADIVDGRNGTKRLHLSKLADIPIVVHRNIPDGKLKTVTVEREGDRWFAVLVYETNVEIPAAVGPPTSPIGVDVGLHSVAALSDGTLIEAPKFYRSGQKRLRRAQKKLCRKQKGSRNWHKQAARVRNLHFKVANQRRDFNHKFTTDLVRQHDLVAFEALSIRSMVRNGHLSKSIADASWGQLRLMSKYKEARRSGRYIEVDAKGTTQECSNCHAAPETPLTLSDRVRSCPKCGLVLDRDINAARNILSRSLGKVSEDIGKLTPVETAPPPSRKGRRAWSRKQEPPSLGIETPTVGPSGPTFGGR
jgi:putative transposase